MDPGLAPGPLAWMASCNGAIDSLDHVMESQLVAGRLSSTASLPPVGIIATAKLDVEPIRAWVYKAGALSVVSQIVAPWRNE